MFAAIHSDHFWNLFDEVSDLHLSFLHRLQDFRKACHCIQIIELHVLGSIEDMPFSLIKFIVVKIYKGFAFTFCSVVLEEMTYRSHPTQCTKYREYRVPFCFRKSARAQRFLMSSLSCTLWLMKPSNLVLQDFPEDVKAIGAEGRGQSKEDFLRSTQISSSFPSNALNSYLVFVSRWSLQLRPRKSKRIGWSRKQWWHRWEMVGIHFADFAFWGFLSSDCWVSLWV